MRAGCATWSTSPSAADRFGEVVDVGSSGDGDAGEVREERSVCPLVAGVRGDARKVEECRCRVFVDREVLGRDSGGFGERVTGCGEPGVDQGESTREAVAASFPS
jgi:hypothetical protein